MKKLKFVISSIVTISSICGYSGNLYKRSSINAVQAKEPGGKVLNNEMNKSQSSSTVYLKAGAGSYDATPAPIIGLGYRYFGDSVGIDTSVSSDLTIRAIPLFKLTDGAKSSSYLGLGAGVGYFPNIGIFTFAIPRDEWYPTLEGLVGWQFKSNGFSPKFFQFEATKSLRNGNDFSDGYRFCITSGIGF